jgi:hypothetical protein
MVASLAMLRAVRRAARQGARGAKTSVVAQNGEKSVNMMQNSGIMWRMIGSNVALGQMPNSKLPDRKISRVRAASGRKWLNLWHKLGI